ncbi:hypothetical protein APSETT444_002022 [Aspergillus pseudonomiae]
MSDTSLSPNAGSLHHAFSDGLGHNPTNPLGQNNLGLLASNLNMWPLPPNSAIMPGNPFHYPPWQPLHEDFVAPRSNIYYDLGMETKLRMPTSFQSDQVATAGYPYGHSSSNTTITPVVMPVEHQPRGVQQETRAKHIDERCNVGGCFRSFNRGDNLKEHMLRVHNCDY